MVSSRSSTFSRINRCLFTVTTFFIYYHWMVNGSLAEKPNCSERNTTEECDTIKSYNVSKQWLQGRVHCKSCFYLHLRHIIDHGDSKRYFSKNVSTGKRLKEVARNPIIDKALDEIDYIAYLKRNKTFEVKNIVRKKKFNAQQVLFRRYHTVERRSINIPKYPNLRDVSESKGSTKTENMHALINPASTLDNVGDQEEYSEEEVDDDSHFLVHHISIANIDINSTTSELEIDDDSNSSVMQTNASEPEFNNRRYPKFETENLNNSMGINHQQSSPKYKLRVVNETEIQTTTQIVNKSNNGASHNTSKIIVKNKLPPDVSNKLRSVKLMNAKDRSMTTHWSKKKVKGLKKYRSAQKKKPTIFKKKIKTKSSAKSNKTKKRPKVSKPKSQKKNKKPVNKTKQNSKKNNAKKNKGKNRKNSTKRAIDNDQLEY
ncbi:uncharacterized protein LOC105697424 [Orussus abietinus]|uniref:uncharacterized protein LOC105697424 n=1 Tax=Orussus abietinus TaxID=222816 RepID=UPI000625A8F4|nr:uncharacterized protein LOC105697424 [Orussus abietinus]XP_012276155.1 uncharacterized protein LOC105697424 [Orussus abietinus]XP_012276156.1 uncharacterized protein LOC105697424 [Orussus abietinus]